MNWLRPGAGLLRVIAATCMHQPDALLDAYPPDALWCSTTHYDPAVDGMPRLSTSADIRQASCYFLSRLHTGVSAAYNTAAYSAMHRNTGSILMMQGKHLDNEWWEFVGDNEDLCIVVQTVGPAIFLGEVAARQDIAVVLVYIFPREKWRKCYQEAYGQQELATYKVVCKN
jgi:hypothetical protein